MGSGLAEFSIRIVAPAEHTSDPRSVRSPLEIGWLPGNVALLTTGHRHYVQVEETDRLGGPSWLLGQWDEGEVFYGHVLGCKGLERPAVVLCLNEGTREERAKEKLYVGMSRATDHLIVVGEPDMIREYALAQQALDDVIH